MLGSRRVIGPPKASGGELKEGDNIPPVLGRFERRQTSHARQAHGN